MLNKFLFIEYSVIVCIHIILLFILFFTPVEFVLFPLFVLYIPFSTLSFLNFDNKFLRGFLWQFMNNEEKLSYITNVRFELLLKTKNAFLLKQIRKGHSKEEIVQGIKVSYPNFSENIRNDAYIDLGININFSKFNENVSNWNLYLTYYLDSQFLAFINKEEIMIENQMFNNFLGEALKNNT